MIATLSPANYNFEETMSTLRYANRAKNIKNKPKINEDPKDAMLRQYQEEINRLKEALQARKTGEAQIITKVLKKVVKKKVRKVMPRKAVSRQKLRRTAQGYGNSEVPDQDDEEVGVAEENDASDEEDDEENGPDATQVSISDLQKQVEEEKQKLMASTGMVAEEKQKVAAELEARAAELEKERQELEALNAQLQAMECQLIVGGVAIHDRVEEQEKEIAKAHEDLELKAKKEQALQEELEVKQEQQLQLEEHYASLQEEVDVKTKKLRKLFSKLDQAKAEIADIEDEFRAEKEDLLGTIRELNREIALKACIIDNFVPLDERQKVEKRAIYNEDADDWELVKITETKAATKIKKLAAKKSLCQYAKTLMAMGEAGPRYRLDNIVTLKVS